MAKTKHAQAAYRRVILWERGEFQNTIADVQRLPWKEELFVVLKSDDVIDNTGQCPGLYCFFIANFTKLN